MFRKICLYLSLAAVVLGSGCSIQPINGPRVGTTLGPQNPGAIGTSTNGAPENSISAYTLKPNDPLYVRFSGVLELQAPMQMVIDERGEISLLHIEHPIVAAGLTTSQLEDKIERLYIDGGIYKTVSVNVTMTAKAYYVQGEVNSPGKFQLTSGTTLVQAIAEARGYTNFANKKKVTITRQGKIYEFNMKQIEKDPTLDVKIEAGDVIKVWQTWY